MSERDRYGVLSIIMTVVVLHLEFSLSRSSMRAPKNNTITILLLFAYSNAVITVPFVSKPTIIEIRGCICFLGTEFCLPLYCHFILLKSDMPSHVSSMLMILFSLRSSFRNAWAYCCLMSRFFAQLPYQLMAEIFL